MDIFQYQIVNEKQISNVGNGFIRSARGAELEIINFRKIYLHRSSLCDRIQCDHPVHQYDYDEQTAYTGYA